MSEPLDQLKLKLKQHGYSLTAGRQTVFSALLDKEPQTMQQLVADCPEIDRASVYRTVGAFEKIGVVQRLQIGWKYKLELSDTFHRHHHHLTCQNCGQANPFKENSAFEKSLQTVASANTFQMSGHQLEIEGVCEACQRS